VVLLAGPDEGNRLVVRQLPETGAVTAVDAQTVMHVYADATRWRLDVLTAKERELLSVRRPAQGRAPSPRERQAPGSASVSRPSPAPALDRLDRAMADELAVNARLPAAAIARAVGQPESTVRRRVAALFDEGSLTTQVVVDHRRLGLSVDANLRIRVLPKLLDRTGRSLAAHPAVHGALATTGPANLQVAVWLRDLDHLYRFITEDLAALDVGYVETMLIGRNVKRPGSLSVAGRTRR
jgi:DNA-binding Lrp family transcriptional regulator